MAAGPTAAAGIRSAGLSISAGERPFPLSPRRGAGSRLRHAIFLEVHDSPAPGGAFFQEVVSRAVGDDAPGAGDQGLRESIMRPGHRMTPGVMIGAVSP
jgi:hypothetical protein